MMQPAPDFRLDAYTFRGQDGRRAVFESLLRDWRGTHVGVAAGLDVLWKLLESGGDLPILRASADADYTETPEQHSAQEKHPPLRVLAVDLAAVPPITTSAARSGTLIYDCIVDPQTRRNWYQEALNHYFSTRAPSLLSLDIVQQKDATCKLVTWQPASISDESQNLLSTDRLGPQKNSFPYTTVHGRDVDTRFKEYCASISRAIEPSLLAGPYDKLAVLWLHVGLPHAHGIKGDDQGVVWSVSLFATLLAGKMEREDELWPRIIDAIHQFLTLGAHETFEQYRTAGRARALTGQAIAHEFKNLTQGISLIANPMHRSIVHLRERRPELQTELEEIAQGSQRLVMLGRLTSAVSLATYWLTHAGVLKKLTFNPDEGGRVLLAAVDLAISLCATTERTWSITGPDILTASQSLASYLNEAVPDRLFERVDAALLLFVAFEPVRNIRNICPMPGRPETVTIETFVEGTEIVIRQTTLEYSDARPADVSSASSSQINQVLENVMGDQKPFAFIDPEVRVVDYNQETEECGRVVRETRIRSERFPLLLNPAGK